MNFKFCFFPPNNLSLFIYLYYMKTTAIIFMSDEKKRQSNFFFFNIKSFFTDARTNDWPLVKSPVPVLTIIAAYLLFVFVIGPIYMRNRKPYDLSAFVRWYNTVKIISNGIIVYFIVHSGWLHKNGVSCVPLDYSLSPQSILVRIILYSSKFKFFNVKYLLYIIKWIINSGFYR